MPNSYFHHFKTISSAYNAHFYSGPVDLSEQKLPNEYARTFMPFAYLKQIHSNTVQEVTEAGFQGEGDALICRVPNITLVIQTADCVPILIYGENEIAAVHAGWKGLASNIITRTLERMHKPISCIIGPCISTINYETGEPVIAAIVKSGVPEYVVKKEGPKKAHCDIRASAEYQLKQAGCSNIIHHDLCTYEHPNLPSYRRNGRQSLRLLSCIGLS
jgi:polyphenol oxidase